MNFELNKRQSKQVDKFLEILCSVEYSLDEKQATEIFEDFDNAVFVCKRLEKLGLINLISSLGNPLYRIDKKDITCSFLKNGGMIKEYEKSINKDNNSVNINYVGGNNYGVQSSKSSLYNPIIKNDIVKPIKRASEIWSLKNIVFTILMGLIVSVIVYAISIFF